MNANLKSIPGGKPGRSADARGKHASDDLVARQSLELIVGLSGPVGAGIKDVRDALAKELVSRGYQPVTIKISELLALQAKKLNIQQDDAPDSSPEFRRIWGLQSIGNELRLELGDDVGAQLAMKEIAFHRANQHPGIPIADIEPTKIAYIVDQLKNPKEVALFRSVYRNLFYLVGVLCGYEKRKKNLVETMPRHLAEQLMERDRAESDKNGQQLEKTLQHADFFISNSRHNLDELRFPITRFVGLIHADNGLTPTPKERGMFAAYTASLRSACLSRQVGAAIVDISGNLIATGCNDVPKAGGGLYEPGEGDQRCVFKGGLCYNDKHKTKFRDEVVTTLLAEGLDLAHAQKMADAIRLKTRLKDLIEFSRAVHAEMDAIVSVARTGAASIDGAVMFTTTFPCHSCARHIVAAGIRAVYYIEPYEKSLASNLHDDSIVSEPENEPEWDVKSPDKKVAFMHFEGVSPHRFTKLFHSSESRKDSAGKAIQGLTGAGKKVPEYLDDYIELESRVIGRLLDEPGSGVQEEPKQPA